VGRIDCGALGRYAGEHRDVAVDVVIVTTSLEAVFCLMMSLMIIFTVAFVKLLKVAPPP
jgi:hypothetical protein